MKKIHLLLIAALCAAAIIIAGIPCQVKALFGVPCPTCGMTRAIRLALGGNFGAAFRMHPLFWLVPAAFAAIFFTKSRRLQKAILIFSLAALLCVWLVRMLLCFPTVPPMDFDRGAVLIQFFERIIKK